MTPNAPIPTPPKPKKGLSASMEGYSKALGSANADQGPPYTKSEANYRIADPGSRDRCETCHNFKEPDTCEVVSGRISPDHISDEFTPERTDNAPPNPADVSGGGAAGAGSAGPTSSKQTGV